MVDSTVLAYVLSTLNKRYDYGLDLYLLSIDEGIVGYRDGSLETVKQNSIDYQLPLVIYSYKVGCIFRCANCRNSSDTRWMRLFLRPKTNRGIRRRAVTAGCFVVRR